MQVTLNQKEIETAIVTFVGNQGISTVGKRTEVTLIAGRGPNGMTASIDISDGGVATNIVTLRQVIEDAAQEKTVIEVSTEDAHESVETNAPEEVIAERPLFGK